MLYDAVLLASDELMAKQQGRKAVILFSDGDDNGSKVTLSRAIESAQRADTLVYSVRFYDRNAGAPLNPGFGGGGGAAEGSRAAVVDIREAIRTRELQRQESAATDFGTKPAGHISKSPAA